MFRLVFIGVISDNGWDCVAANTVIGNKVNVSIIGNRSNEFFACNECLNIDKVRFII